jgi:hypothetical protein
MVRLRNLWVIWGLFLQEPSFAEEAIQPSTGRVKGTLLVFGGVVIDKRSAFVLEGGEDDVFHRPAPETGAFMQVSDELTAKDPKVVAMFAQCFAG